MSDDDDPRPNVLQRAVPDAVRSRFALKFTLVLLLMVASVGAVGLLATGQLQNETRETARADYQRLSVQEADTVEEWFTRNEIATKLASRNDAWTGDEGLSLALRNERGALAGDVAHVHLVNRRLSETTVVDSTTLEPGANISAVDRGWVVGESFDSASDVATSSVYETESGHVVGFVSPVPGSDSRYLLVEHRVDALARSLTGAESEAGGFTQVVDADGRVVIDEARTEGGGLGDAVLEPYNGGVSQELLDAAAAGPDSGDREAGVRIGNPGGYTIGYAPVRGTDWVVLVHAPYSEVFSFVQQVQQWGLIATVVAMLSIGGVGAVVGYNTASAIDRLRRKTEEMREGNLEVDIETARIDSIGQLYGAFAAMRDALQQQIEEAERARKEAEVSRTEAVRVNEYLEEKATEFGEVMERTAGGDMTQRMTTDGESEAMDRIAREFNHMIGELEKTTGQLQSFADEVAESGDVVYDSAESVREAAERVAASVEEISGAATDQRDRLETVTRNLHEVVETLEAARTDDDEAAIDDAIASFREAAQALESATEASEEMVAESERAEDAAQDQAEDLDEVSSRADRLKRYARPLGDILDRFETDAEHEFVFSGGPSQSSRGTDDE